jgi:hypothetical protein
MGTTSADSDTNSIIRQHATGPCVTLISRQHGTNESWVARRWRTLGLLAVLASVGGSTPGFAQTDDHGGHHDGTAGMFHVGNSAPYPMLRDASRTNRRKAHRLRAASLRSAVRFDTLEEATRRGYVPRADISPLYWPGLQHFRKRGPRFWGHVLNPRQPQALVFWCPSIGECRLAAFVYRAPPATPPTYGGLLGWHRHVTGGSWMTHVWLTANLATSLAQCAPFNALHARDPMLAWEPYKADVPMMDEACPDTTGLQQSPGDVASIGSDRERVPVAVPKR